MRMDAMIIAMVVAVTACRDANTARSISSSASAAPFSAYDAGAVAGGPGAKQQFAIGTAANDSLLQAMNHDVGSDGADLPTGSGTAAQGAVLYAAQCAQCHGKNGEGMPPAFPQLVGRDPKAEKFQFANDPKLPHTIGNYWPYATTLFDYIKRAMPLATPGSLTNDETYALSAYLLAANDVIADSVTLDAAALRKVKMPYLDRFVPDDRKPSARK